MQRLVDQFYEISYESLRIPYLWFFMDINTFIQQLQQVSAKTLSLIMESKEIRLMIADYLMKTLEPSIVKLEKGQIVRLSDRILIEKTVDEKIIFYEVTE